MVCEIIVLVVCFSTFVLLVGWQEGHLTCSKKNLLQQLNGDLTGLTVD